MVAVALGSEPILRETVKKNRLITEPQHQCNGKFTASVYLKNASQNSRQQQKRINGFKNGYHQPVSNGVETAVYSEGLRRLRPPEENRDLETFEEPHMFVMIMTYLGYAVLLVSGFFQNLLQKYGVRKTADCLKQPGREGYVDLYSQFEVFYTQHVYRRLKDCWCNPLTGVPGAEITLKDRISKDNGWTFSFPGTTKDCLNLGSYNYLGFAQNEGPCADNAELATREYGLSIGSPKHEIGTLAIHVEMDQLIAEFLGVEDAIVFGMGFATNSMNLPALAEPGTLILSDELNHTSLILGCRLSGASIKVYKHNDMKDLERRLRDAVVYGRPRTHRPWKKIIVICEGVYSMEGSIVHLPEVIALKKKYKAYLYLDEAHSIGAMGPSGRGVVDYYGCDPKDVDILMGTFTKSFGAAGGYIAGKKSLIDYVRCHSHSSCYGSSMSAPVAHQVMTSARIIMGKDGTSDGINRILRLHWNTRYFRHGLHKRGFIVYGNNYSPVVPMLIYHPSKTAFFIRDMLRRGIATVAIGFPATTLETARARFCVSAAHTKEMLDRCLEEIDDVGNMVSLKYSRLPFATKFKLDPGENFDDPACKNLPYDVVGKSANL